MVNIVTVDVLLGGSLVILAFLFIASGFFLGVYAADKSRK